MDRCLIPEPAPPVRVASSPHPFKAAVHDLHIAEGRTLAEILEIIQPDEILRRHAVICIDDWPVPRPYWSSVRPKAGRLVSIKVVPEGGGGGKSPLRTILTLGVIAASFAFAGPLGTALVGAEGLALGAGITISASSVGSAVILGVGSILVNAIAPVRPPSIGSGPNNPAESPSFFIDQARNAIRPLAPVPVIFGRHRVIPPLGAVPVTEAVGDYNHLRQIFVWGYGPCRVTDIRIGETPIGDFDDVRINTFEGRDSDDEPSLYTNDVHQDNFSISLENAPANTDPEPPGAWSTRRSEANADELSIDIAFPRGIAEFDDRGKRGSYSVVVQVQYRTAGGSTWTNLGESVITSRSIGIDGVAQTSGELTFTGSQTTPLRHGIRWSVDNGQYDVRLRRVSVDDEEDGQFSVTTWVALRTITHRPPIDFPENLCFSEIDIRATGQLSGAIDELSGTVECEALDWNGSSWVTAYTRNPASLFRLALQHPARRRPTPDDEIDLEALEEFHEFCEDNDYKFDHVLDVRQSVWDTLSDICAVARASPTRIGDKWSVIVDTGTQAVRQHFTPLNSRNAQMRRAFDPPPHAVRGSFANEDEDWLRDERIVYADNYNDSNAVNIIDMSPVGITNPDHLWKFLRFHMAQILVRREIWTREVGFESLVVQRGDRVTVSDDVIAVGLASARVIEIEENASGHVEAVTIDAPIHFPDDSITYGAKIRTVDNANLVEELTLTGGEDTDPVDRLAFATAIDADIEIGALLSVGETGREYIDGLVTGISRADDLTGLVSIIPYQEDVYDAETGTLPTFDSKVAGTRIRLPNLVIESIVSDLAALRRLGFGVETAILINVQPVDVDGATIEVEIKPHDTDDPYGAALVTSRTENSVVIGNVEDEAEYDIRLRWTRTRDGRTDVGRWTVEDHTVGTIEDFAPIAYEEIFASTDSATVSSGQRPDNDWGFRTPGTRGGLEWHLTAADLLTEAHPYLWKCRRQIRGYILEGGDVEEDWDDPELIGRFPADGQPGLNGIDGAMGEDGEDGKGYEWIFARSSSASVPSSQRPLNSWGFDQPESRGGLTWHDAAPTLSEGNPYLWRCQRRVDGAPDVGDSVSDTWSSPTIVGRFGTDGEDGLQGVAGADGEDADGVEYIFARTNGATPSSPSNNWGFDNPQSPWSDAAPSLSVTLDTLWRCERDIVGSPAFNSAVSDSWSTSPDRRSLRAGRHGRNSRAAGVAEDLSR